METALGNTQISILLARLVLVLNGFGINVLLIISLLYFFYNHESNKVYNENFRKRYIYILSGLISFCIVLGNSYIEYGNWTYLFGSKFQALWALIVCSGYYIFFLKLFEILILKITGVKYSNKSCNKYIEFIFDRHYILIPFIIIMMRGLPYFIAFFPGPIQYDALKQLDFYFGVLEWTTHHSPFSTFVMGSLMKLGRTVHSNNLGVFLYAFQQYIL